MKAYENEYKDYNQFQLGDTHSATRVIYAEDIERFAEVSGDFNAIHLDEEYASKTPFKHRIAHGMLVASVLSAACAPYFGSGAIYVGHTQRFLAPVYIGDTLTSTLEVQKQLTEKRMLVFRGYVQNQQGTIVLDGELTVKII